MIKPAQVVRDDMGSFQHPDMHDFDEGDGDKCKQILFKCGYCTQMMP
ncbi:hypothetical protein [Pseudomonas sp. RL_5y_Pfl2_69]